MFRIRGPLLTCCFMDSSINTLTIRSGETPENVIVPLRPQSAAGAGGGGKDTGDGGAASKTPLPSDPLPEGDQQVAVFCTEKSASVYGLPSQRQMYCQTVNESSSVVAASVINFGRCGQ